MFRWLNWFIVLIDSKCVIWLRCQLLRYKAPAIDEWLLSNGGVTFFFHGTIAPSGPRPPHLDTPHSAGLCWMSGQPDAETSTWQHRTLTIDRHPCPRGTRTRNPSKRAAADPLLSTATGISLVEWYWEKTEVFREKPIPVPLHPLLISHGLAWDWTQAPAERSLRLNVRSMSRSNELSPWSRL
jgi:hypothetical protein